MSGAVPKTAMNILSYEARAAVHRCYSCVWSDLIPALARQYNLSAATVRFLHGADPAQITLTDASFQKLDAAFKSVLGRGTVPARAGGSIPVVPALASAGAPVILTGIGLPDDDTGA